MAQDRFKNFSVYGDNGRKVEFQTDATLSGKSNAEQVIVDGKVAGSTEGVETSTASIDMAICIGGKDSSQSIFDLYKSKKYTDFTFGVIDGRVLSANMMVDSFDYTGKAANGSTTFKCSLIGGEIKKVG
jgi:hypothetical protein